MGHTSASATPGPIFGTSSIAKADDNQPSFSPEICANPLWSGMALALGVDPAVTQPNADRDLRVWYRKFVAFQEALQKMEELRKQSKWPFNAAKTELINLFGKRAMWNSHVSPGMKHNL